MAVDPVPWMIGGGAEHSPAVTRSLAYAATGGGSGISTSLALVVRPLASAAGAVTVDPGVCAILGTYANQQAQSYIGRVISQTQLTIVGTGGTARSDMIVARIDDPEYGGSVPSDPKVGPYFKLEVITNVGSTATAVPASVTYPAIPLARIDIPAGTTAITGAMIKDLRKMATRWTERRMYFPSARAGYLTARGAGATQRWPVPDLLSIDVPRRATKCRIVASISGFRIGAPAYGNIYIGISSTYGKTVGFDTQDSATGLTRSTVIAADTFDVPPEWRGTAQELVIRGRYLNGSDLSTNRPFADASTEVILDVEFSEEPATS